MSIISSLLAEKLTEAQLPDMLTDASGYLNVPEDFVISRTRNGYALSRYKDDAWDMAPYSAQGWCLYNFISWCPSPQSALAISIKLEMKQIVIAMMYLSRKAIKASTIRTRVQSLRLLALWAFQNNVSLQDLFTNESLHKFLLSSFAQLVRGTAGNLLTLFKDCFAIKSTHSEFAGSLSNHELIERMEAILVAMPKRDDNAGRTKLIPTRIYAALITGLSGLLDEFNENAEALVEWARLRKGNAYFACPDRVEKSCNQAVSFREARDLLGLRELFIIHNIDRHDKLASYISTIQGASKYWIHLFTGMRDNEVNTLPSDAYTRVEIGDAEITVLRGYTSKIEGQNHTSTYWITCEAIEKAILAAQQIGVIYALKNDFYDRSNASQYPLFPAAYGQKARRAIHIQREKKLKSDKHAYYISHFVGAPFKSYTSFSATTTRIIELIPELAIQDGDIRELELFDGFRDWRSDEVCQIGNAWPLATHQCRRSLAVYCARSGMVSLPTLALQFKHLTQMMTAYYREGSVFAENFIFERDQKLLLKDLQSELTKQSFILFEAGVINTSSKLWGGEGNRIQVAKDRNKLPKFLGDRTETMRRFEKGEMAYRETLFGGCTNTDPCDKIAFTAVISCIDCAHAVFDDRSIGKMRRAAARMERSRDIYDESSPFYQQVTKELEAINGTLERIALRDITETPA